MNLFSSLKDEYFYRDFRRISTAILQRHNARIATVARCVSQLKFST